MTAPRSSSDLAAGAIRFTPGRGYSRVRPLLTKVPDVTTAFWVVMVLSTTVGRTAANYLSVDLGLGLAATTAVMSELFAAVLIVQVSTRCYVPAVYWLVVVLVSTLGTLSPDNLVDDLGASLWTSTAVLSVCLSAVLVAWYRVEHTVSIDSVLTRRREGFYWLAVLLTFALGSSAGELVSDHLVSGYVASTLLVGGVIALVAVAHLRFGLSSVVAFWAVCIATRPFGASLGDYLTAGPRHGGLGLGTNDTCASFLVVILGIVGWFTVQERRRGPAYDAPGTQTRADVTPVIPRRRFIGAEMGTGTERDQLTERPRPGPIPPPQETS